MLKNRGGSNTCFDFADCRSEMVSTAEEKAFVETKSLKLAIAARLAKILGGQVLASDNPGCPRVLSLIVALGRDI